jgi:isoleucyl-tRNA synthetase
VDEGLVRELVHRVQNLRREQGFEIEDLVSVSLGGSPHLVDLLRGPWGDYFKSEVLARELRLSAEVEPREEGRPAEPAEFSVDGEHLWVRVERFEQV